MKLEEELKQLGLPEGRMLSASKSYYLNQNPDNTVFFNANIFSGNQKCKVWFGDLDLTKDSEILIEAAQRADDELFVLREMDGRFGQENIDLELIKEKSVWWVKREQL